MRALCVALIASVLLAVACSALTSSSSLTTKWSLPLGVNQSTLMAFNSDLVIANAGGKIVALNATNGETVWSVPAGNHPNLTLNKLAIDDKTQTVFVGFAPQQGQPGQMPANGHLYSYKLADGDKVVDISMPGGASFTGHTNNDLILGFPTLNATSHATGLNLLSYSLATGALKMNTTTFKLQSDGPLAASIGKDIIAVSGFPTDPTAGVGIYTFDVNTGDVICHASAGFGSTVTLVGNTVVGQDGPADQPSLFNGAKAVKGTHKCQKIASFPADQGGKLTVNGDSFYNFVRSDNSLSRITDRGVKSWTVTIKNTTIEGFFMVSSTAFQPGAIIVNNQGTFTALNVSTGASMWHTSTVVPFGPKNAANQEVYPLGHHTLFVPNLQGYVLLDTKNGGTVKEVNEHSPMTTAASFMGSKPFVVFGELMTGNLRAVEL